MSKTAIGIDIGGTTIQAGLVDETGRVIKQRTVPTPKTGRDAVLSQMVKLIHGLKEMDTVGVGIGSPGFIDSDNAQVLSIVANIPGWAETNVRQELVERGIDVPIKLENDANTQAIAESWIGAAKDNDSFVLITLGTGVGGAVMLPGNQLLRGSHDHGGELGHMILYPGGVRCGCGQTGCVDRYLSGTALEAFYKERSGVFKPARDIFLSDSDELAKKLVEEFCQNLVTFLVSIKNVFDPSLIIIGGGVSQTKSYWDEVLRLTKTSLNDSTQLNIVPATSGIDAGVIGAAYLVLSDK